MGRVTAANEIEQVEERPVVRVRKEQSEYRQVDRLSFSALAKYVLNRKAFVQEYILKSADEKCDEEDSKFLRFGSLIDILETAEAEFEQHFVITTAVIPTPQLASFCRYMRDVRVVNPEATFEYVSMSAYEILKEGNGGKLRDKYDLFVANFKKDGMGYYTELINSIGKTVITVDEFTIAKQVVQKIRDCKAFQVEHDLVLKKLPIYFDLGEYPLKAELDKVYVSHKDKVLYLRDLKTSSFIESFFRDGFLKRLYYIQASLYKFALEVYIQGTEYEGYKVENMAFEVVDSGNWNLPLLYTTTDEHYQQGFNGFYFGGRHFKGITQILDEIAFHKDNGNWNMSVDNIIKNGIVQIPAFKDELDYD